jgi:hypothetical protein
MKKAAMARTAIPPMTPPTMAPMGVFFFLAWDLMVGLRLDEPSDVGVLAGSSLVVSVLVSSVLVSEVDVGASENVVSGSLVTVTVGASVIFVVPPPARSVSEAELTRNAVVL